jgi:hypothetical protein
MGVALRAMWLWLHRTDPDRAWTSLPMNEDSLTKVFFDTSVQLILGDGATFLFWVNPWFEVAQLADFTLDLVAITSWHSRRRRTVAEALQDHAMF